jgi:general secretion pathway protein G
MIELVFVIVILGILSVVALPKLMGTRDDAVKTKLIGNVRTCVNDAISSYKGQGINPDLETIPTCVYANANGATITINGDYVHVVDSGLSSLDGDYRMKGTSVRY